MLLACIETPTERRLQNPTERRLQNPKLPAWVDVNGCLKNKSYGFEVGKLLEVTSSSPTWTLDLQSTQTNGTLDPVLGKLPLFWVRTWELQAPGQKYSPNISSAHAT